MFEPAVKKISNLLGMTLKGQNVKSESLSVALASNDDLVVNAGATSDAAVTTDSNGSLSAKIRGLVVWLTRISGVDNNAFTADSSYVQRSLVGVYQSTVSLLTAGRSGLARLTQRRAVITAPDSYSARGIKNNVTEIGDVEGSAISTMNYAAPTSAFFDGADAGFDANPRYLRFPMDGFTTLTLGFENYLGVNVTVELYAWVHGQQNAADDVFLVYSEAAIANGTKILLAPFAGGSGAASALKTVPAMLTPCKYWVLGITPASDPSSGYFSFRSLRK